MAHSLSALKRIRQSKKGLIRNHSAKAELKTLSRKFYDSISVDKKEEAQTLLKELYRAYDKTAKRGIIHQKAADRKKSRLSAFLKTQKK